MLGLLPFILYIVLLPFGLTGGGSSMEMQRQIEEQKQQVEEEQRQIEELDTAMVHFREEVGKIRIGDSKNTVLSVLLPTQSRLLRKWQKPPRSYDEGNHLLEIYYIRTNLVPDGDVTDDEFTPFIFRDRVLVSIGWRMIHGGPGSLSSMQAVIQPSQ